MLVYPDSFHAQFAVQNNRDHFDLLYIMLGQDVWVIMAPSDWL